MAFKERLASTSASFGSIASRTKEIWAIPKGRSQLISYFVLVGLSFCPLILCAIIFAVSNPTAAARTAIYLVAAAFALVATGYWTYLAKKRLTRILAKHDRDSYRMRQRPKKHHKKLPTHHVNTAVDAFNSEQRIYEQDMANYSLNPHGQYAMPNPPDTDYLPYAPLQMPTAEPQTNNLYLVPMPMPPRSEPLHIRNVAGPQGGHGAQQVAMPQPPPPTYHGNAPMMPQPPVPPQPREQYSDSATTLPPIPPLPPLELSAPQAQARPPQTLDRPAVPGTKAAPGPSRPVDRAPPAANQGQERAADDQHAEADIEFDTEDESDDDDESVKLFSFDKVKVRSDSPQEHQRYGSPSRMNIVSSVESINPSASQQSLVVGDHPANADASESKQLPAKPVDANSNSQDINATSSGQISSGDLPSQPETMSSGTKSVLEKFPEPPKSKLRLSVFPQNTSEADLVEKWLQASAHPEPPNPEIRSIGQQATGSASSSKNPATSALASSTPDLVVPDKYAPMHGLQITKSPTHPLAHNQNMSIYGERDALANISVGGSDTAGSHLNLPERPLIPPPATQPVAEAALRPPPPPPPVLPPTADRPPLATSKPDPRDLVDIDEPLLESSDLSLRRPTLVDYQKKADAKRKMMEAADDSSSQGIPEPLPEQIKPEDTSDSRYFSAVSLPQSQAQAQAQAIKPVAAVSKFAPIKEEANDHSDSDDEGFLDSDSDDEPIGSIPQSATAAANKPAQQTNPSITVQKIPQNTAIQPSEPRPPSANFENLAAQLAMAITNSNSNQPHDSLVSTHAAGLRESLLYNAQSPGAGHRRDDSLDIANYSSQIGTLHNRQLNSVLFDEPRVPPRPSDSSIFLDGEDYGADLEMTSVNREKK